MAYWSLDVWLYLGSLVVCVQRNNYDSNFFFHLSDVPHGIELSFFYLSCNTL